MSTGDIIKSIETRIDDLSKDLQAAADSITLTSLREVELLKVKFDMMQERNSAIIMDLNHLARAFKLEDDASNNVFSAVLESPAGALQFSSIGDKPQVRAFGLHTATHHPSELSASAISPSLDLVQDFVNHGAGTQNQHLSLSLRMNAPLSKQLNSPSLHEEVTTWKTHPTISPRMSGERRHCEVRYIGNNENELPRISRRRDELYTDTPSKLPRVRAPAPAVCSPWEKQNATDTKKLQYLKDWVDISEFTLQMSNQPTTVFALYSEFETSLGPQMLEYEKRYGKGQSSRLPRIRTFQRRRALVSEIDKFSRRTGRPIEEAIAYFELIRTRNRRSVAWLYNNLTRIMKEYC